MSRTRALVYNDVRVRVRVRARVRARVRVGAVRFRIRDVFKAINPDTQS